MANSDNVNDQHNETHAHPVSMYALTLGALIVLMVTTVLVAEHPTGSTLLNNVIAMTIAVIKGTLVLMFFMHVKYSSNLAKLWALLGFTWLTLMSLILADYGSRKWEPVQSWNQDPGSAFAREKRMPLGDKDPDFVNVRPRQ